jgi:hypothetical protein
MLRTPQEHLSYTMAYTCLHSSRDVSYLLPVQLALFQELATVSKITKSTRSMLVIPQQECLGGLIIADKQVQE